MTPSELIKVLEEYKDNINDILFVNDYVMVKEFNIKYSSGILEIHFDYPPFENPDRYTEEGKE